MRRFKVKQQVIVEAGDHFFGYSHITLNGKDDEKRYENPFSNSRNPIKAQIIQFLRHDPIPVPLYLLRLENGKTLPMREDHMFLKTKLDEYIYG